MRKALSVGMEELWRQSVKKQYEAWVQPKSGDLLGDGKYFLGKAKAEAEPRIRARYGRATVVLSAAGIEAITNDALATLYVFLGDSWPSEIIDSPPCTYFKRTSWRRVERLLKRGKLNQKMDYLFRHIDRLTDLEPADDLMARLSQILQARNRIVHMSYLLNPNKYPSVLNNRQVVYVAKVACDTASEYIDLLNEAFEEFKLPIETIRPGWWFNEELSYPLIHPGN